MSIEDVFGSEPAPQEPQTEEQPQVQESAPQEPHAEEQPQVQESAPQQVPQHQTVPLAALTEERARRKELQQQNAQMQQRFNEMILRLQQTQQPVIQQPVQQLPDLESDPVAYVQAMKQQIDDQLAQVNQWRNQQSQQAQLMDQHTQFVQQVASAEAAFTKAVPDYVEASRFVQQRKLHEYQALGLDPMQAQQRLAQDTMQVAQLAFQRGMNPAELMYNAAQQLGYKRANAQSSQQKPQAPGSLGGVGGSVQSDTTGQPTLEALSSMSDQEFDVWWDKMHKGSTKGLNLQ